MRECVFGQDQPNGLRMRKCVFGQDHPNGLRMRGCLKKMLISRWLSGCVCIRVPMVLLSDVVYYTLLLDAIGAFGVVIWMIIWFLCLRMHNDDRYEPHH